MSFNSPELKVFAREELEQILRVRQSLGEKVVFTNGCFDLLHVGHARYLRQARQLGDCLVIGLNTDESVRELKGELRPLICEADRAELLSSLQFVDYVTLFDEQTPIKTIEILKPDVHVKGGDYRIEDLPEASTVQAYGGRIEIIPLVEGRSTTNLIERIVEAYGR